MELLRHPQAPLELCFIHRMGPMTKIWGLSSWKVVRVGNLGGGPVLGRVLLVLEAQAYWSGKDGGDWVGRSMVRSLEMMF